MDELRSIYYIGKTDFLHTLRQFRFNVIVIMMMIIIYYLIPDESAKFTAMYFNGYRGVYDSIWIGNIIAFTSAIFISLFGFYIVKNSIQRDSRLRINEFIKSSSLKLSTYIHGKALGNFMILLYISLLMIITGIVTQIIRGEVQSVNIVDYSVPFLLFSVPVIFTTGIVAVLFDCIPVLRNAAGSILYFIVFFFINFSVMFYGKGYLDLYGFNIIYTHIVDSIKTVAPNYGGSVSIFYGGLINSLTTFNLPRIHWTLTMIFSRYINVLYAYLVLWISIFIYKRVYSKEMENSSISFKLSSLIYESEIQRKDKYDFKPTKAKVLNRQISFNKLNFIQLIFLELKIKLKDENISYLLLILFTSLLTFVTPLETAWNIVYAFLWLFFLPFLSKQSVYDKKKRTVEILSYSPYSKYRILSSYFSSVMLITILSSGIILRLLLSGKPSEAILVFSGILLMTSVLYVMSAISGSLKIFEFLFIFWWYIGTINNVEMFDFTGYSLRGQNIITTSLIYLLISTVCVSLLYLTPKFARNKMLS